MTEDVRQWADYDRLQQIMTEEVQIMTEDVQIMTDYVRRCAEYDRRCQTMGRL